MRKMILIGVLFLAAIFGYGMADAAAAHSDYFNYPCNYPFTGVSGSVDLFVYAGGQYCDGPMEINGSHYHCESGGGGVGGGGIGLGALPGGISLGGFGGSGIGGAAGSCSWRCPDNTTTRPPNPPAAWVRHLVVDEKYNDCSGHMEPAGINSTPQAPDSGPPGPGEDPNGHLSKPKPPPPPEKPDLAPTTVDPGAVEIPPSPLTPGGPLPLP